MELLTLHDILTAWQEDRIDHREAMRLARIDTPDELHEAAELSGVAIRSGLHDAESQQADLIAGLIRGQAKLRTAPAPRTS